MEILVDDIRTFGVDIIARNYSAAQKVVLGCGTEIDVLWLDHDLGEEKTGYDLIQWMMQIQYKPRKVRIVSLNPVGRENITKCLKANSYTLTWDGWFILAEEY